MIRITALAWRTIFKFLVLEAMVRFGPKFADFIKKKSSSLIKMFGRSVVLPTSFVVKNSEILSDIESDTLTGLSFSRQPEDVKISFSRIMPDTDDDCTEETNCKILFFLDGFTVFELRLFAKIFGLRLADDRCIKNFPLSVAELDLKDEDVFVFAGVDVNHGGSMNFVSIPTLAVYENGSKKKSKFSFELELFDAKEPLKGRIYVVFHDSPNLNRLERLRVFVVNVSSKIGSFLPKII